ncbi:hypothetical protein GO755_38290 [Spirosoma sp. HMF4905]|uniref:Uncharacterized protein n=1 Tax=Spirosoma arboris TaxID=2682092 RepID=A0A7K1SQQ1_9BACT|nr:hypothetical protein [Spirosoma arboris]MVM35926.1 hypothetical protein [Spirosoma arboris]
MKTFEQTYWKSTDTFSGLYNHVGYVATTYRLVQNIDALSKARESFSIAQPSYSSAIKAVFQGAEVALINMAALLKRAASLLNDGKDSEAAELILVFNGFNTSMTQLSRVPGELGGCDDFDHQPLVLSITDSTNYPHFLQAKKEFDQALLAYYQIKNDTDCAANSRLGTVMKQQGLGETTCQMQQLVAQADHDMRVWYANLKSVEVDAQGVDYQNFVGVSYITEAIQSPAYGAETLMNQFRSFHITPEIFAVEINNHIRFAIAKIQLYDEVGEEQLLQEAYEHLMCGNTLFPCIQKCFDALAEGLSYAQYHKFRGNFGATSASESKAIAKDLLKMLPAQLGCEVVKSLTGITTNPRHPKSTHELSVALLKPALHGQHRWLWRMITQECAKVYTHVMTWYDGHFKLPILQVGSSPSLAGAKDAIQHNFNLQNRVREHNPLNPLVAVRHLQVSLPSDDDKLNSLTAYINSDESFFSVRANTIGAVNRSMLTHLCDGNADFEQLKKFQKECREQEKQIDNEEDSCLNNRLEAYKEGVRLRMNSPKFTYETVSA